MITRFTENQRRVVLPDRNRTWYGRSIGLFFGFFPPDLWQ
jgi:hypothetical protein